MNILVVIDNYPYSSYVIHEISKIALNTWCDITLLGFPEKRDESFDIRNSSIVKTTIDYLQTIISYYDGNFCPYNLPEKIEFSPKDKSSFIFQSKKGRKKLKAVICTGDYIDGILNQVREVKPSLLVIGCDKNTNCKWRGKDIPALIANKVSCSVLIVKENKTPEEIVCCLDNSHITQESLELINQLSTLYRADIKIVGIAENNTMKVKVEKTMKDLLMYYLKQDISVWLEVVDKSVLPSFLNQVAQKDIIALWVGQQSFLKKLIPNDRINNLINNTSSSILLLR